MTDLPFLLRLVDDPSPRVAARVAARLREIGPDVWRLIDEGRLELSNSQRLALETMFLDDAAFSHVESHARLATEWARLGQIEDEMEFLEGALVALSNWQNKGDSRRVSERLDELALEFRAFGDTSDALALAHFLFDFCGLRGARPADFYEPRNSDLKWVLEEGVGLPISLACVFILVGARLGLPIEGCNFPGHFLARDGRRQIVFDPYNRGRMLSAREVATLEKAAPAEMRAPASSRDIITRVLRNLSVAFHHQGENDNAKLMLELARL